MIGLMNTTIVYLIPRAYLLLPQLQPLEWRVGKLTIHLLFATLQLITLTHPVTNLIIRNILPKKPPRYAIAGTVPRDDKTPGRSPIRTAE